MRLKATAKVSEAPSHTTASAGQFTAGSTPPPVSQRCPVGISVMPEPKASPKRTPLPEGLAILKRRMRRRLSTPSGGNLELAAGWFTRESWGRGGRPSISARGRDKAGRAFLICAQPPVNPLAWQ